MAMGAQCARLRQTRSLNGFPCLPCHPFPLEIMGATEQPARLLRFASIASRRVPGHRRHTTASAPAPDFRFFHGRV